jgi:transcriptional regulator with XRE-family HTH domain
MKQTHRRSYPDLKAWREDHGLSQKEAAQILLVSRESYSRYERGARFVKGSLAKRLTITTGVPLEVISGAA